MSISTFHGLNTALRGLLTQQRSLDTVTHNVANAGTEGYTRQEAVHAATDSLAHLSVFGMIMPGQLGTGVEVETYRRIRDRFNDNALRGQFGKQADASVRHDVLGRIELTLPEPSDQGLQSLMSGFWSAWQDVSTNPSNSGARTALVQRSQSMAAAFNTASADLAEQLADVNTQADSAVGEINAIATQIAALNDSIAKLIAVGQEPNDLRDTRDKLIDDLSRLGNTAVTYSGNEMATVTVGGLVVVDPSGATARTRAEFDTQFGSGALSAGKLRGLIDGFVNAIPNMTAKLDALAIALHDAINTQHAAGFDLAGVGGGRFFTAAAITSASQLAVDPALIANANLIAASASAAGAPGDSGNALAIIGLRANPAPAGSTLGTTFDDYYTAMISALGTEAQGAERDQDTFDGVVLSLENRRSEVSGVSLDEEMANMVRFQHAFSAAGRMLSAMDEMLDVVVHMGRVGT